MLQIYDIGPTALLPLRRKVYWGFFRPKNPTASAGFEPANSGTKGQHATPRPPEPILHTHRSKIKLSLCTWLGGGIAPIILNLGTTWKWEANSTSQPLYPSKWEPSLSQITEVKFFNSELQSNSNIESPFVHRSSWRCIKDGGKSKYCVIRRFCLQTVTDA